MVNTGARQRTTLVLCRARVDKAMEKALRAVEYVRAAYFSLAADADITIEALLEKNVEGTPLSAYAEQLDFYKSRLDAVAETSPSEVWFHKLRIGSLADTETQEFRDGAHSTTLYSRWTPRLCRISESRAHGLWQGCEPSRAGVLAACWRLLHIAQCWSATLHVHVHPFSAHGRGAECSVCSTLSHSPYWLCCQQTQSSATMHDTAAGTDGPLHGGHGTPAV